MQISSEIHRFQGLQITQQLLLLLLFHVYYCSSVQNHPARGSPWTALRELEGWGGQGAIPACPNQTSSPCSRLVTRQQQLPGAPSAEINVCGIETHIISLPFAHILKRNPVSLIFSIRKATHSPVLFTSSPRSQQGDEAFGTCSDTVLVSLCPTWGYLPGSLIFPPQSPRLGSG